MELITFLMALAAIILALRNKSEINKISTSRLKSQEKESKEMPVLGKNSKEGVHALSASNAPRGLRHGQDFRGATTASSKPKRSGISGAFLAWLKKDPLMKVGALFVLAAFSWFVSYAYSENWIGPHELIFSGILLSVTVTVYGFFDSYKLRERGLTLLGLGNIMILMVIFAARYAYDMFDAQIALGLMFMVTAFVSFAAVRFSSPVLAGVTYVFAALMPMLTKSPHPSFYGLFSFLLLINVATLSIVYFRKWHFLVTLSFIATSAYSLIAFNQFHIAESETFFAYIFAVLFAAVSLVALLRVRPDDKDAKRHYLSIAIVNTIFIALWTVMGLPKDLYSFMFMAWAFVLLVLSFSAFVLAKRTAPFMVFGASAMLFLAFVTINELEMEALLAAFALEALIAVLATSFLLKDYKMSKRAALVFLVPSFLSFAAIEGFSGYQADIWGPWALSLYVFMASLAIVAEFLRRYFVQNYKELLGVLKALWGFLAFWVMMLIWLIPHALLPYGDTATYISIIIYTTIGLLLYFNRHERQRELLHKLGLAILVGVIIRILLIDVWELDILGRIAVFATVGVALISTAYRYSHSKHESEPGTSDLDQNNSKPGILS